jgi:serine/threonine protein kinase
MSSVKNCPFQPGTNPKQVLLHRRYNRAVDWWSFGVLIYVMLFGRYPFHGDDENDILDAILADAIEFPPNMPKDVLSVLVGLLTKNPARRLGGGALDAEEVMQHPYFAGVDWQAVMTRKVPPPFVPTVVCVWLCLGACCCGVGHG